MQYAYIRIHYIEVMGHIKNDGLDCWQTGRYSLADLHRGQNSRDVVSSSADGCRGSQLFIIAFPWAPRVLSAAFLHYNYNAVAILRMRDPQGNSRGDAA